MSKCIAEQMHQQPARREQRLLLAESFLHSTPTTSTTNCTTARLLWSLVSRPFFAALAAAAARLTLRHRITSGITYAAAAAVAYLCEGLSYRTRDPTTHHQWWMLNLLARKCLRFYFLIFYKYTAVVVVGGYCVVPLC